MKKKHYLRALAGIAAMVAAAGAGGISYAAANGVAAGGIVVKGADHNRLTFTLAPGARRVFKLPDANDPVRVDIATVSTNGAIQTPSEVFSALINVDANGAGMSWIGTSSDGSQNANSTVYGRDITNLVCGPGCVIARLDVGNVAARTVVLSTNAATSIIRETYVVNIWY